MERRDFLKTAGAAGVGAAIPVAAQTNQTRPGTIQRPQVPGMIYRELGKTGEMVSGIGMGGYHLGKQQDPAESIRLIHAGVDAGITFMDNCWDYNDGLSEVRMGQALKTGGYRQKVFLMTKMDGRTADEYAKQLEQSLGRLQTEMIDLVQFHEVIRMEDPDRIFAKGGAIEAALKAREQGKIRYIGFTGHKDPAVHLRMLEVAAKNNFHFDTVQMPINVMDAHFRSFTHEVMPVALKQGIGVLAMKTFGEDPTIDKLIRKFGYCGTPKTLEYVKEDAGLAANLSAAAHLIHGSSEGRFTIRYCPGGLKREEIEGVHYKYGDLAEYEKKYDPAKLKDGWNVVDGEEIFYISNPGLGLWAYKGRFVN